MTKKKDKKKIVKLVHKETGQIYYTKKSNKTLDKLQFKKYNSKTRKRELFIESK